MECALQHSLACPRERLCGAHRSGAQMVKQNTGLATVARDKSLSKRFSCERLSVAQSRPRNGTTEGPRRQVDPS